MKYLPRPVVAYLERHLEQNPAPRVALVVVDGDEQAFLVRPDAEADWQLPSGGVWFGRSRHAAAALLQHQLGLDEPLSAFHQIAVGFAPHRDRRARVTYFAITVVGRRPRPGRQVHAVEPFEIDGLDDHVARSVADMVRAGVRALDQAAQQ